MTHKPIPPKTAIHCPTEDIFMEVRDVLNSMGLFQHPNIPDQSWKVSKETTCLSRTHGNYYEARNIKYYAYLARTIISAEQFLAEYGEPESNLYFCLYQYHGMETEGNIVSDRKFICRASDEAEALWMYMAYLNNGIPSKLLSEYRKTEFASGGWGWFAYQLHESQEKFRDDQQWFLDKIKPFRL